MKYMYICLMLGINYRNAHSHKAWGNSWHFVMLPLVLPRNDVWGMGAKIPYWWRDTITQIWVVLLIGWNFSSTNRKRIRSATQTWAVTCRQYGISALISHTSVRGETMPSAGVAKCRLFSWANSYIASLFGTNWIILWCFYIDTWFWFLSSLKMI